MKNLIFLTVLAAFVSACNTPYEAVQQEPEKIACDTLYDRMTGEAIPIYDCPNAVW